MEIKRLSGDRTTSLIITHAGITTGVQSRLYVCHSVCPHSKSLTGKQIELSTPNEVHVYSTAVARHALTTCQKVKGQGHTVRKSSPLHVCYIHTYIHKFFV